MEICRYRTYFFDLAIQVGQNVLVVFSLKALDKFQSWDITAASSLNSSFESKWVDFSVLMPIYL